MSMKYSYRIQLQNKIPRDGRSRHPLYPTWSNMMRRCYDVDNDEYHTYGGRGITVSEEWDDFWKFVKDVSPKPKGMSLDRINNDLGYSKENCKWSTRKEQQTNTQVYKGFTIWQEIHPTKNYQRWRARINRKSAKSFKTEQEAIKWVAEQKNSLNISHTILLEKYKKKSF